MTTQTTASLTTETTTTDLDLDLARAVYLAAHDADFAALIGTRSPVEAARHLCLTLAVVSDHQSDYPEFDAYGRALGVCRDDRATIAQLIIAVGYLHRHPHYVPPVDEDEDEDECRLARLASAVYRVREALAELADAEAGWSQRRCTAEESAWHREHTCLVAARAITAALPRPEEEASASD